MFPEAKTTLKVITKGLPPMVGSSDKTFEFRILLKADCFNLTIPGTPRGFDLVTAHSEKQENWLKELEKTFECGFKEIWYCLWEIDDEMTLEKFLEIIESNIIEKEYS